ncbi:MAG: hypothetical protein CVV27_00225 [Candidatus Melainabacteria bacterium HGW-Melainabacteria-1]|nr:MAG: hypothetical protein CVV27_00225 [Candidatus Melainabacteria bacterium HGW-Melainabacteria-1]
MKAAAGLLALLLLAAVWIPVKAGGAHNPFMIQQLKSDTATGAYSFIVTGDNRDGDAVFERILRRGRDYSPRFMLHTGDFVAAGGQADYQRFRSLLARADYPVLPVIGNHDAQGQGRRWYARYFGETEFAFRYGKDHFIFVDNAGYQVSATQRQRLARLLKEPARYRFVIMHMPPGNLIWFHSFTQGSQETMRVLEAHNANYVFLGHIHIFDKNTFRGVNYLISGGAGAPLYRMPLYFSDRGGAYHHFTLIQVSGAGIKDTVIKL